MAWLPANESVMRPLGSSANAGDWRREFFVCVARMNFKTLDVWGESLGSLNGRRRSC